jgi:hypothetical protein
VQEWAADDFEDDDWHEDTIEWREKEKKNTKIDPNDISSIMKAAEGGGGGMQMCFISLKPGLTADDAKALGAKWQGVPSNGCGLRSTSHNCLVFSHLPTLHLSRLRVCSFVCLLVFPQRCC